MSSVREAQIPPLVETAKAAAPSAEEATPCQVRAGAELELQVAPELVEE